VDVKGLTAMVVGGASGMGRATAVRLASLGARVAVLDRPASDGAAAASELGGGSAFYPCDVTDVAVNTAGGGISKRTLAKDGPHPLDAFRSVIELNLIATFNLNRLQAWHMSRNEPLDGERGVIVNTSSIAAFEGQVGQVAYTAAKAGIAGMALTMARELGSLGIRVMAIAPSLFATGITAGIPDEMASALTRDAAYPRRMGRPEEYASLAVAIVENQMLNGGTIRLDGGQRFAPK
jgi:NAD(P)-dependent dehydrogenase (short-subunit alcohol dehydrogenase family)